jgi:hypothetical protein
MKGISAPLDDRSRAARRRARFDIDAATTTRDETDASSRKLNGLGLPDGSTADETIDFTKFSIAR